MSEAKNPTAKVRATVPFGATRENVKELLGEPDKVGGTSRKQRIPTVYKYGATELFFSMTGELVTVYWEDGEGNAVAVEENGVSITRYDKADLQGEMAAN